MDFGHTAKVEQLRGALLEFMDEHVYPAEPVARAQVEASGSPYFHPPALEDLKKEARARGLWNLFLPDERWATGLSNLEYAPLAEITGRSPWLAPEAMNCSAPDTGNMELLAQFGTPEQQDRWLKPLLEGEIRSCFAMTEPDVASSDATNIRSRIERHGDLFVLNGRKWWTTGAMSDRCKVCIFMGVTDPDADPYHRQSMVLVPMDAPGVTVERGLSVFGYRGGGGDAQIRFEDVRVPVAEGLLGEEGGGFAIAQARLGPGRIHHCMRAIGMAERAFDMMCHRAIGRTAFGKELARQGVIQQWIAQSRMEIEQARLLVLKAAWLMDTVGKDGARVEISAIKVVAPRVALAVIDRAIQVHGAAGVSADFPLAEMYAAARTLRIADGPDEVHEMVLARRELKRYLPPGVLESPPPG
ncbi:MAG TPA: acyl-CoA dehydrogenase family protein [Actinomycetota bacterium]|nr:acyl-CoA dehydrogenase family protein [Actinomycetota bacterium]